MNEKEWNEEIERDLEFSDKQRRESDNRRTERESLSKVDFP